MPKSVDHSTLVPRQEGHDGDEPRVRSCLHVNCHSDLFSSNLYVGGVAFTDRHHELCLYLSLSLSLCVFCLSLRLTSLPLVLGLPRPSSHTGILYVSPRPVPLPARVSVSLTLRFLCLRSSVPLRLSLYPCATPPTTPSPTLGLSLSKVSTTPPYSLLYRCRTDTPLHSLLNHYYCRTANPHPWSSVSAFTALSSRPSVGSTGEPS